MAFHLIKAAPDRGIVDMVRSARHKKNRVTMVAGFILVDGSPRLLTWLAISSFSHNLSCGCSWPVD